MGDLDDVAVSDHAGVGCVHDRQPVQGALRSDLLDDPDERVRDDDAAEQGVIERPDDEDHDEERADDEVEAGEDVGLDDLRDGAGGRVGHVVAQPPRGPIGGLRRCQPDADVRRGHGRTVRPLARRPRVPTGGNCQ